MDSWLTYTDYQERCPDTTLTEAEFRQLAAKAALEIEGATHWRAVLAALPEEISQLAECQVQSGRRQRRTGKSVRCNERQQPRLFRELRRSAEHAGCDPAATGSADPAGSVRSGYPLDDLRRCGLSPAA